MTTSLRARLSSTLLAASLVGAVSVAVPAQADAATNSCRSYVLKKGSTGYCVRQLQALLRGPFNSSAYGGTRNLAIDGSFGPATQAAVRTYQRSAHIAVDGVAGPQTWRSICSIGFGGGSGPRATSSWALAFKTTC